MLLAALGLISLRKDRQLVEQEAHDRAQGIAENLGRALAEKVESELFLYSNAEFTWLAQLKIDQGWTQWANPADKIGAVSGDIAQWVAAHPEIDFALMPQALWSAFDASGRLQRDYPSAPVPPAWLLNLTDEQRRLWQNAQNSAAGASNSVNANTELQQFISSSSDSNAVANAEFLLLQSQCRELPPAEASRKFAHFAGHRTWINRESGPPLAIETEVGLPLSQIAYATAIQVLPDEMSIPPDLLRSAGLDFMERPSVLVPSLLDLLAQRTNRADTEFSRGVETLRLLWQVDERTRHILHALRKACLKQEII